MSPLNMCEMATNCVVVFAKVHLVGYNSVADSTSLSSFVLPLLPLKSAKSREITRKFELIAVQGHPRTKVINLVIGANRKRMQLPISR